MKTNPLKLILFGLTFICLDVPFLIGDLSNLLNFVGFIFKVDIFPDLIGYILVLLGISSKVFSNDYTKRSKILLIYSIVFSLVLNIYTYVIMNSNSSLSELFGYSVWYELVLSGIQIGAIFYLIKGVSMTTTYISIRNPLLNLSTLSKSYLIIQVGIILITVLTFYISIPSYVNWATELVNLILYSVIGFIIYNIFKNQNCSKTIKDH